MKDHNDFPEMYREHILDMYRNPSNYGEIKNPTGEKTEHNSLCGDEITIQMKTDKNKINDIKFSGSGCVISMVSASLLTNELKGKKIEDAKNIGKEDVLKLLGVKINPARIKCALLSLEAVRGALR